MRLQIGVKVIIRSTEGKILLIRRSKLLQDESEPSWDIPGGRIEPEEPLDAALRREVKEELGVDIDETAMLINAQDIFVPSKNLHVVRLTYILTCSMLDIVLSEEHQEYRWVLSDDLQSMNIEPYLKQSLGLLK